MAHHLVSQAWRQPVRNAAAMLVYVKLCDAAKAKDGDDGYTTLSVAMLAADTGCGEKTVRRALAQLVAEGRIELVDKGRRWTPSRYRVPASAGHHDRLNQPVIQSHQPVIQSHQPVIQSHQPVILTHQPVTMTTTTSSTSTTTPTAREGESGSGSTVRASGWWAKDGTPVPATIVHKYNDHARADRKGYERHMAATCVRIDKAKRDASCAMCGVDIEKGDAIWWNRETQYAYHQTCPDEVQLAWSSLMDVESDDYGLTADEWQWLQQHGAPTQQRPSFSEGGYVTAADMLKRL